MKTAKWSKTSSPFAQVRLSPAKRWAKVIEVPAWPPGSWPNKYLGFEAMIVPTEAPEFLPFDFVYAGRRALKGDKPGAEIFKVVDGQLGDRYVFAAKSLRGSVIGGVYRGAMFSKDQARGLGCVAFVERWKDSVACIDWRSRDEAFDANQRRNKLEADSKRVNEIEAILLPLRKLYASYTRQYDQAGKEALEQAVLRALRSPPRKSEAE